MALTLKYNPVAYTSAHKDVLFTILEDVKPFDSTTYPDYKYVCDVYVSGIIIARLKSFPRPGDKIGIFDIGSVVRNYLTTEFIPHPTDVFYQKLGSGQFYVEVTCKFGEEYGFTTYPNIIIDSDRTYFNHYNGRQFGTNTILPNYLDKVTSTRPYATSVTRTSTHNLIPFLTSDDSTVVCELKYYNKSTGLVRQTSFNIVPTAASVNELLQVNISPIALNFNFPATQIDDYIDYYTVKFSTPNIVDDSIYRFDIVCEKKYEVQTLHFLNKFGGFESKEFTKVSRKTHNITKSDYSKSPYVIDSNGIPAWYNSTSKVYNEQSSVYASTWEEKMQINTDILTDAEYVWIGELIKSPLVYFQSNGYFYCVKIADSNYEEKKIINDKLTNLVVNIEFGETFNTQYR